MPIYAYRCDACGHAKDVLQKISDPVLTDCPVCGAATFKKQVTAAGFQLKGSGWYVTDFRGGNAAPAGDKTEGASAAPSTAVAPATTASTPAAATSATPAAPSATTPSVTTSNAAPATSSSGSAT
jgi:putative FmdB family regulatory protein